MQLFSSAVFHSQILQLKAMIYISFREDYSTYLVAHKTPEIQVVAYFQLVINKAQGPTINITLSFMSPLLGCLYNILVVFTHELVLEQLV